MARRSRPARKATAAAAARSLASSTRDLLDAMCDHPVEWADLIAAAQAENLSQFRPRHPDVDVIAAEVRVLDALPAGLHRDVQTCLDARLEHNLALMFAAFEFGRQVGAVRSR
jgi:hypothetical protein